MKKYIYTYLSIENYFILFKETVTRHLKVKNNLFFPTHHIPTIHLIVSYLSRKQRMVTLVYYASQKLTVIPEKKITNAC